MTGRFRRELLVAAAAVTVWSAGRTQEAPEAGSRPFHVQLSEEMTTDNNLFRLPADLDLAETTLGPSASRDDRVNRVSAQASGAWTLGLQRFALEALIADNRFANNSFLDNRSGGGTLDWAWRLASRWSGTLGADYERSLAGFANNRFLGKDLFDTLTYRGSARLELTPRWSLNAEAKDARASHENVSRRVDDFNSRSGTLGLAYRSPSGNELGWDSGYTRATFPTQAVLDGLAFDRDYSERSTHFRVKYGFSEKTSLQGSVGYLKRDYDHEPEGDFSGSVWRASLQWQPSVKTQITASGWRDLKAYLDSESNHFVSRGESLECVWLPLSTLSLSVQFSSEKQDYMGVYSDIVFQAARRDRLSSEQATLTYLSSHQHFSFELTYRAEQRDSNRDFFLYDDTLLHATVAWRF